MRPSPKYRAVSRNRASARPIRISDTTIPPHSFYTGNLTPVDMREHAGRRGKAKQKIGLWGTVSPYYKTSATIDIRWSATITNRSA